MDPPRPLGKVRVGAACSTLLGPGGAWLYELGHIEWFGPTSLLNLWVVVGAAVTGVIIGIHAVVRGVRLFGLGSLLVNCSVAALYGFLALFFGLGGTR